MDEKTAARKREKLRGNGLGGAQNTPNSQLGGSSPVFVETRQRRQKRRHAQSGDLDPNSKMFKGNEMPKGQALIDQVWHEIDVQQREKREHDAIRREAMRASTSADGGSRQPIFGELTAANLKAIRVDDTMAKSFIHRETMVDRLLGYKMLFGKMENFATLGYVKMEDPSDYSGVSKSKRGGTSRPKGPHTPPPLEEENVAIRRGPKTPPGSPGPPSPRGVDDKQQLLTYMAQATGHSIEQVEMFLGNDLNKAIDKFDNKEELLSSLKTALQTLSGTRNGLSQNPSASKVDGHLSDQMELVSETSLPDNKERKESLLESPLPPPPPLPGFLPPPIPPPPPPMCPVMLPPMTIPPPLVVCMPPTHMPPPHIKFNSTAPPPPPPPTSAIQMPAMNVPPPSIGVPPPNIALTVPKQPPPPPPPKVTVKIVPLNTPPPTAMVTPVKKPAVELKSIVDVESKKGGNEQIVTKTSTKVPSTSQSNTWTPKSNNGVIGATPPPTAVSHNVQNTLFSALGLSANSKVSTDIPSKPCSSRDPVLLDRYGCPLPVPGSTRAPTERSPHFSISSTPNSSSAANPTNTNHVPQFFNINPPSTMRNNNCSGFFNTPKY